MWWTEINISNNDELIRHLLSYGSGWLFRGHSYESWELASTLERALSPVGWEPELARKCEEYSLHIFKCKAHHYISKDLIPSTKLGWLSLMQHHGVPTRLIDFTESPFIALFFALDAVSPAQKDNCAIWAINYRKLMKSCIEHLKTQVVGFDMDYSEVQMRPDEVFEQYIEPGLVELLWVTEPKTFNLRLERQKGTFLLTTKIELRASDLLQKCLPPESIHKIIVPASMSVDVFKSLKAMGIDNSRLFADLDGLAKDVKNEMVHQVPNRLINPKS